MKRNLIFSSVLTLIVLSGCNQHQIESVDDVVLQEIDNVIVFSKLIDGYWQLWTMQPDGKELKQLTDSAHDKRYPRWTIDGEGVLFRNNSNHAYRLDLDTGSETRILTTFGRIGNLVPSPVEETLLFARYRSEVKDSSDLWLASHSGKNQRMLTKDPGLQYDPAWSSDGKRIAYISGHGYQTHELCLLDVETPKKQQLTKNKALELLPAFSPDGSKIAYVSDITGDFEIWLMDLEGKQSIQLTQSMGIDTSPCWSPDGKRIMYVSVADGNQQLWIMNRDGSNKVQLTDSQPSIDPAWRMTAK